MSANNRLVADAAAFCAKQREVCSEKPSRQVTPAGVASGFEVPITEVERELSQLAAFPHPPAAADWDNPRSDSNQDTAPAG
jgi:hypothetical protein